MYFKKTLIPGVYRGVILRKTQGTKLGTQELNVEVGTQKILDYNVTGMLCACMRIEYPKGCFRQSREEDPEPGD